MKLEEWKKQITEKSKAVSDAFAELGKLTESLDLIEGKFDEDELGAFIFAKMNKMNKAIENVTK